MAGLKSFNTVYNFVKEIEKIKVLYDNLKKDFSDMPYNEARLESRRIIRSLSKIDFEKIKEELKEIKTNSLYSNTVEDAIESLKQVEQIKKFLYSIENPEKVIPAEKEDNNAIYNKKINYIRDKYKFLEKQELTGEANTGDLKKDAQRLNNIMARLDFEDLPEGDYEEMVDIKNNLANLVKKYQGVEKSEIYGPYFKNALYDLFLNNITLGNKNKAEHLANKIADYVEDPEKIDLFEPAIKRIISKKMTPKEFRTFYYNLKPIVFTKKFESFNTYKGQYDKFYLL